MKSNTLTQYRSALDATPDIDWTQYYNSFPVLFFPNPTEGFIRFEFNVVGAFQNAFVYIFKTDNPSQAPITDNFTDNFYSTVFDLSSRSNGIYTMAINVDGNWVTAKQFVINH